MLRCGDIMIHFVSEMYSSCSCIDLWLISAVWKFSYSLYQRCGGSFTDVDGSRYSIKDVGVHLYMWWLTASEMWVAHYGHMETHFKMKWLI